MVFNINNVVMDINSEVNESKCQKMTRMLTVTYLNISYFCNDSKITADYVFKNKETWLGYTDLWFCHYIRQVSQFSADTYVHKYAARLAI